MHQLHRRRRYACERAQQHAWVASLAQPLVRARTRPSHYRDRPPAFGDAGARGGVAEEPRDREHALAAHPDHQQLEAAYQQTAGAIAGLYEFAPDVEGEDSGEIEAPAENGQPDLELVEA